MVAARRPVFPLPAVAGLMRRFSRATVPNKIAWMVLAGLVLSAAFAPWLAPYNPFTIHAADSLKGPGRQYLLGTDQLGRDLLSLLLNGGRISLSVATAAEVVAIAFGLPLGLVAGYRRGFLDAAISRLLDGLLGIPGFLIALTIVGLFGSSIPNLVIAIGIMNMPYLARIVRGAVLVERERPYVLAARAIGLSDRQIVAGTILPNILSPLIVQISFGLAVAVLIESALSFLGVGVQPPQETWGSLLGTGYSFIRVTPWQVIFPGACIFAAVWALNVLGDSLRDALDPRLRKGAGLET